MRERAKIDQMVLSVPADMWEQETERGDRWTTAEGELQPGLHVGEFVIDYKLAEGGMGEIYAAHHPLIGKKAAIKVLSSRVCDEVGAQRFLLEAQAVNQIGHPNIVDIFSFGELGDDRHFFVMEWLEGGDLESVVDAGALGLARTLSILEPVCAALGAAHASGIVHRDLKPQNIFIDRSRGYDIVKLLDFGIAKIAAPQTERKTPTRTGVILGTPAYISPEQARSKKVDERTDIYSLGAMIFEMLTGELPFVGDSAMDTVSLHLHQPPPRVSERWSEVPARLDDLVLRMMAKEPAERPSLDEIRKIIAEVRIEETPRKRKAPARRKSLGLDQTLDPRSSVATRLTPRVKLRRLRPWTLVLMLLGGLALAGYGVWEQYRPPSHLRALPAVGSTESPRQADQTVDVKPLVEPSEPPLIDHSDSKVDEPSGERGRPAAGAKPARRARPILDRQASEPSPPTPATPGVEQPEPATGSESGEPTENNDDLDYMVDPFAD